MDSNLLVYQEWSRTLGHSAPGMADSRNFQQNHSSDERNLSIMPFSILRNEWFLRWGLCLCRFIWTSFLELDRFCCWRMIPKTPSNKFSLRFAYSSMPAYGLRLQIACTAYSRKSGVRG